MDYEKSNKTISQSMLAKFAHQQAAMLEQREHYNKVRQQLLESLDAGAKAEPGALILNVNVVETRRFTNANVLEHLGEEQTAWLKSMIPATTSRTLRVYQRFCRNNASYQ